MTISMKTTAGLAGLAIAAVFAGMPAASAEPHRDFDREGGVHRQHASPHRDFDREGGVHRRHASPHRHTLPRVYAQGAALSRSEARREAVHNWRDKVAARYGYQFSRWWTARDKDVDCVKVADDDPSWDTYGKREKRFDRPRHYEPVTRCTVSAIPARGWGHFGWSGF